VLWVIKGLGPGGAEQLLVNQAGASDRTLVEPEVVYLVPTKSHRVPELEALGVAATCLDGPRDTDLAWAGRLRRRLTRDPVDVIHVHSPAVAAVVRVVVASLPASRRPALVSTEHNRWPRYRWPTRWANRVTGRLDDATFAVSDDVRSTMPPRRRDRVEVLVHGTDPVAVRAALGARDEVRAGLGIGPDEVVVGTVANFRAQKGYPDLLAAASLAPGVRVVAVGQGPLEDEIRARHRGLGLGDRVQLTGYVPDAARVMSAFDVFTLASVHEGLPVALMDALVLGLPVAATDVGGIPQAVTDGVEGLLVPSRRPELLAAAWEELAADPARRAEMGAAARVAGAKFDIVHAAARLDRLYVSLAARRRGGAPSPS
jgi:glycosyltransferase involved in cell wall biosynthesis